MLQFGGQLNDFAFGLLQIAQDLLQVRLDGDLFGLELKRQKRHGGGRDDGPRDREGPPQDDDQRKRSGHTDIGSCTAPHPKSASGPYSDFTH